MGSCEAFRLIFFDLCTVGQPLTISRPQIYVLNKAPKDESWQKTNPAGCIVLPTNVYKRSRQATTWIEEKAVIRQKISVVLLAMAITAPAVLMFACNGGPNDPDGDTTPPLIVSVSPAEDAVEVAVDAVIRVVFSEVIDTNKITAATFSVSPAVAGSFHFDGDTVIFAPAMELAYATDYVVSVTTGVTDLAGNRMAANKSWSFETAGNPATTPPLVISSVPLPW